MHDQCACVYGKAHQIFAKFYYRVSEWLPVLRAIVYNDGSPSRSAERKGDAVDDGSSLVLLGVCGFVCVAAGLVAIVGLLLLRATGRGASAILSDLLGRGRYDSDDPRLVVRTARRIDANIIARSSNFDEALARHSRAAGDAPPGPPGSASDFVPPPGFEKPPSPSIQRRPPARRRPTAVDDDDEQFYDEFLGG